MTQPITLYHNPSYYTKYAILYYIISYHTLLYYVSICLCVCVAVSAVCVCVFAEPLPSEPEKSMIRTCIGFDTLGRINAIWPPRLPIDFACSKEGLLTYIQYDTL